MVNNTRTAAALIASCLWLGCDDDSSTGDGSDAASDVVFEMGSDAGEDTDAGEVGEDTGADSDADVAEDAPDDSALDTPVDAALPPATPSGLAVERADRQLAVSWDAVVEADEYVVGRSTTSGGPYVDLPAVATTELLDTDLVNRVVYYYVVRARNDAGDSGNSGEVSEYPYAMGRQLCVGSNDVLVRTVAGGEESAVTLIFGQGLPGLTEPSTAFFDPTRDALLYLSGAMVSAVGRETEVALSTHYWRFGGSDVGTPLGDALGIVVDPDDGTLVVSDETLGIFSFPSTGRTAEPFRELSFPSRRIALDTTNDRLVAISAAGTAIATFELDAADDDEALTTIEGDATGLADATDVAVDNTNSEIWVADASTNSLLAFALADDEDAAPDRILTLPDGVFLEGNDVMTFDSERNQVIVAVSNSGTVEVRAYDRDDEGEAEPARTITSPEDNALLAAVAYDGEADELWVMYQHRPLIHVFAGNADGAAEPVRVIDPDDNADLWSMTYDEAAQELWVGTDDGLVVLGSDLDPEPVRMLPYDFETTNLGNTYGIAIMADAEEVAFSGGDVIAVFARNADETDEPIRAIEGDTTGLTDSWGLVFDEENDLLIVANNGSDTITAYGRDAEGDALPDHTLDVAEVAPAPVGLAFDPVRHELYVASPDTNVVVIYAWPPAAEDDPPLRTVTPQNLSFIKSIALDFVNHELLIGNGSSGDTLVEAFALDADGDDEPLWAAQPSNYMVVEVSGIALCDDLE